MLQGCAGAAGETSWGLVAGARADALVVDPRDDALLGIEAKRSLDALVFSSPAAPWRDVMVAGRWVIGAGAHARSPAIADRFAAALDQLAAAPSAPPGR
jgi:formimidoylglutamate deiminase